MVKRKPSSLFRLFQKPAVSLSDKEIISLFVEKGEQELLGELFSRYTHLVFGVCLKYLEDSDDASDAVMSLYEKVGSELLKHKVENFSSWLYVMAKNHCLMELRKRKSEGRRQEEWIKDQQFFMENSFVMHPIDEGNGYDPKKLYNCIEQLKAEQKNCIELFYFKEQCYREIALALQLEEKTVKSHLQNGKRKLKICLEGK